MNFDNSYTDSGCCIDHSLYLGGKKKPKLHKDDIKVFGLVVSGFILISGVLGILFSDIGGDQGHMFCLTGGISLVVIGSFILGRLSKS